MAEDSMTTVSDTEFTQRAPELLAIVEAGNTVVVHRDEQPIARLEPTSTRMALESTTPHILKKPGVCGGRACIAGHRVRVQDIVVLHEQRGLSVKEIQEEYPGITLADIHAALTYYFDNRAEIEAEFGKAEEWAKWAADNLPSKIPTELKEKLRG
jgi:uncharacterized protein (DUF433 family)